MTKTSKVSLDEAIAESEQEAKDFVIELDRDRSRFFYGEPLYPADLKVLDDVTEGVLWYADISSHRVSFHALHIEKVTPCGYWVRQPYSYKPVWRSKDSKKASKTRRAALDHLFARKSSYVAHSKRRLQDAQGQCNIAEAAWKLAKGDQDE